ncbi:MAG: type II toxin-antitoxin system YafQ family toxin [Candidatus Symbiobacter sp.]|nr:type II toxin-antitoxin system YafQ family toxin [Candidatus Symbiobacter sp.]
MRDIEKAKSFRQDLKRESLGRYRNQIDELVFQALTYLAEDVPLPAKFHDHALKGKLRGFRECHLKPDLLLIYRKPDEHSLELTRLGSHSELGLG